MLKISIILYLLSDIRCAYYNNNECEVNNVSVRERARLLDVNEQNSEMPRDTLEYSWMRSDSGLRQGSKLVINDRQASLCSQKLEARPVNNKSQYEVINLNSQAKSKYNQKTTGETSFTYESERPNQNKKSTGAIPKQPNKNSFTFKAEVYDKQQSSKTSDNRKFIKTNQSKQRAENIEKKDKSFQSKCQLNQIISEQSPNTLELVSRTKNTAKIDEIKTSEESKKNKKEDDGVSDCTSAIFCFLDMVFG